MNRRHPIIYVRGYAGTAGERDETAADPFCGFNFGSTVYRATPRKDDPPRKFVFESPVVRLMKDFGYKDVYDRGFDIADDDWSGPIAYSSIIIYRYYDKGSTLLGGGTPSPIEEYASGLSDLILRTRSLATGKGSPGKVAAADFRCYLVAHSMGGLVCRAFLQNRDCGHPAARACVDKLFTYATPHNGIELAGINVPEWLSKNDINNFNRDRMAGFLALREEYAATKRVDWIPEQTFPSRRVFCLVGTNRMDYEAAQGLSRNFAGHGSDGLVKIANASVWGIGPNRVATRPCATAYVYRAHSGAFGIVNSEEGYQNLRRFLFGDVRVDIHADIDTVVLPRALQKSRTVDAAYQFECRVAPRGKRWYLSRRIAEEDSVAVRSHQELLDTTKPGKRSVYLSTVFLETAQAVNPRSTTLTYKLEFGIRTPDYETDRKFWPNDHFEGGYIFNGAVFVQLTPPARAGAKWAVAWAWDRDPTPNDVPEHIDAGAASEFEIRVPFGNVEKAPALTGSLRFVVSPWNR